MHARSRALRFSSVRPPRSALLPVQNVAAFNSDTTRLACGGEDGVVRLYSIMKDSRGGGGTAAPALIVTLSAELPGHTAPITDLVFAASGGLVRGCVTPGLCVRARGTAPFRQRWRQPYRVCVCVCVCVYIYA
jgi:WD40 repeat protein